MSPDAMISDNFIGTSIFRHCWRLLNLQSIFMDCISKRLDPFGTIFRSRSPGLIVMALSSRPLNLDGWRLLLLAGVSRKFGSPPTSPCARYTTVAPKSVFQPAEVNFLRPAYWTTGGAQFSTSWQVPTSTAIAKAIFACPREISSEPQKFPE